MPAIDQTIPDAADVIICGGGGAGCLIAARLATELPDLEILLIEEGADNRESARLTKPLDSLFWLFDDSPYLRWLDCEPGRGLEGRKPRIPVGRVLGGGTSINTLMYNTPGASDFDDWGQEGWAYRDLAPFIKRTVGYHVDEGLPPGESPHGREGAFEVTRGGHEVDWGTAVHTALAQTRDISLVPSLTDFRTANGVAKQPKLIDTHGQRSNTANAYIHTSTSANLHVLTRTTVVRLLLDAPSGSTAKTKASGVEVLTSNGRTRGITARRLVILSCGALGSPAVLERSGVGDPDVLRGAGVECVVDIPGVGDGLDDHQLTCTTYHVSPDLDTFDAYALDEPGARQAADEEWERAGTGMVASNGFDWGYKVRPTADEIKAMGPEFEKHWTAHGGHKTDKVLYSNVVINYYYASPPRPPKGKFISIGGFHNYPASRGSVHITSSDPRGLLTVDAGLLNHHADLPVHVWHYKLAREVARRLPFFIAEHDLTHPRFPPSSPAALRPPNSPPYTDAQRQALVPISYTAEDDMVIEDWVRKTVATAYHSMSTCPMRPRESGGVVDCRLGVHGIEGLKVADLSICPSNVGGNTTSVVLLIAEKAVQLVLEDLKAK